MWYNSPFVLRPKPGVHRTYELLGEWRPGIEYSLEIDTMAFTDTANVRVQPFKAVFTPRIPRLEELVESTTD